MRKWMALFMLIALLAAGRPAHADSAPLIAVGPNLQPMDSTTVRMESERIDINLQRHPAEPGRYSWDAVGNYRIVFHFVPTADETMTAGFPLASQYGPQQSMGARIRDFKVRADGRELPFETRAVSLSYWQQDWAVFTLTFRKDQPLDLEVTYALDIEPFGKGWSADLWLGYILKTGAFWAGTIGKAEANVRLDRPLRAEDVQTRADAFGTTPGWTLQDGALHWEWRDFEPDFDLSVLMTNRYWHDSPADLQALIAAGVKDRDDLLRIWNGTFALFVGDGKSGLWPKVGGVSSAKAGEPLLPDVLRLLSDYVRANPQDTGMRENYLRLLGNSSLHLVEDDSHHGYYSLYNEERYRTWLAEARKYAAETNNQSLYAQQSFPWFAQRTVAHLSDAGQAETAAALLELMPARFPTEAEARQWATQAAGVQEPVLTGQHAQSLLEAALQRIAPTPPESPQPQPQQPETPSTAPTPEHTAPTGAGPWPTWAAIAAGLFAAAAAAGAFLWSRHRRISGGK